MWFYFVYDSPAQHPRINKEEQEHIVKSLGGNISKKKVKISQTKFNLFKKQKKSFNQLIDFAGDATVRQSIDIRAVFGVDCFALW